MSHISKTYIVPNFLFLTLSVALICEIICIRLVLIFRQRTLHWATNFQSSLFLRFDLHDIFFFSRKNDIQMFPKIYWPRVKMFKSRWMMWKTPWTIIFFCLLFAKSFHWVKFLDLGLQIWVKSTKGLNNSLHLLRKKTNKD